MLPEEKMDACGTASTGRRVVMAYCATCGAGFHLYHRGDRFCSTACRMRWHDARRKAERAEARATGKRLSLVWLKDLPSASDFPEWRMPKAYAAS